MKIKTLAENRKTVVKAMEEILGEKASYQGPPTFSYTIGTFTIDRDGIVETEDEEEGIRMQGELANAGLAEGETTELNIEVATAAQTPEGLKNLIFMVYSKQRLLSRAMGREALGVPDELVQAISGKDVTLETIRTALAENPPKGIMIGENSITFSGFPVTSESGDTYTRLAAAMVDTAFNQKRISPDQTLEENEKYYMRIWLVRLGFGGKAGKTVRATLLKNLKGHTAFRTPEDAEKWKEKYGNKRSKKVAEA